VFFLLSLGAYMDREQTGRRSDHVLSIVWYYLATDFLGHGTVNPKAHDTDVPIR
jgi:hypothetical protein